MDLAINANSTASRPTWFKSSYSNDSGGNCVEVADLTGRIGIRDSKTPEGPALTFTPNAFTNFLTATKRTAFDHH
ncbi:DUF397 domain-containing protein [Streptomyces sp. NPDC006798]|uniref:DUF397 domain-containing protein n=1 Tax=Streptomyces sp. NPDC006798 TaxID=3155462 RepID=UPI0033D9FAED